MGMGKVFEHTLPIFAEIRSKMKAHKYTTQI